MGLFSFSFPFFNSNSDSEEEKPTYARVNSDENDDVDDEGREVVLSDESLESSPSSDNSTPIIYFLSILTLLIALLTTSLNFYGFSNPSAKSTTASSNSPLRRPNQYIGLERITFNDSSIDEKLELKLLPNVMFQLDRTKGKINVEEGTGYDKKFFKMSNNISTIVQFRTRDWGMEWCSLSLSLPQQQDEGGWTTQGDLADIQIWSILPQTTFFSSSSRSSQITRHERMSTLDLSNSTTRTGESIRFHCAADSVVSVEVFCVGPGCLVRGWQQDRRRSKPGITLIQRSSL